MRLERAGTAAKGWHVGPWNSELPLAIGYATTAIDEPHRHARLTEIYLVGRGACTALVDGAVLRLTAGDVLIVAPGEAHTMIDATADYFHFVLQTPPPGEALGASDKVPVPRDQLAAGAA